ncbi:MAG: dephospho-CoA kinase [Thermodesulfobacteriota bacterium]
MNIGVTGVMGGGKSRVAHRLGHLLDAHLLNVDLVCRDLLQKGAPGWQGMKNLWADRFFDQRGEVDRSRLRSQIFADPHLRSSLESILHPLTRQAVFDAFRRCKEAGIFLIVEVPLLFEVGWQDDFDRVVVVYADPLTAVSRIVKRDGVDCQAASRSLESQMPGAQKALQGDWTINNSGHYADTILQLNHLVQLIRKELKRSSS